MSEPLGTVEDSTPGGPDAAEAGAGSVEETDE